MAIAVVSGNGRHSSFFVRHPGAVLDAPLLAGGGLRPNLVGNAWGVRASGGRRGSRLHHGANRETPFRRLRSTAAQRLRQVVLGGGCMGNCGADYPDAPDAWR